LKPYGDMGSANGSGTRKFDAYLRDDFRHLVDRGPIVQAETGDSFARTSRSAIS
jgi:hypothetical protein